MSKTDAGKVGKLLGRISKAVNGDREVYVTGSGLVHIPITRLSEIPKVIRDHHDQEREKILMLMRLRRVA
jgi:hypothetical protein